jgi:hypothetical protein
MTLNPFSPNEKVLISQESNSQQRPQIHTKYISPNTYSLYLPDTKVMGKNHVYTITVGLVTENFLFCDRNLN